MNLTLPLSRNHFHPVWLLLPLPPLVAIALQWFNDNEAEFLILGLRAILLGVLVGAMAVLRFHGGAGPGLRLLKEMRQQLPGALLALLVPGVFAWSGSDSAVPWALGSFAIGCLLLGANAFGAEFEQRTLAGLLAQPISRARLYLVRLHVAPWLVAGIMVLLAVLVWLLRSWVDPESSLARSLNDLSLLAVFAGLLGTLALVVAGAASVAEERELGTFEWQLTQLVTLARQWLVKIGVATTVALTFGILLPAGLLWLNFEPETFARAFGEVHPVALTTYVACFLLLFVVSVYASSISRSTMRATASTVFIAGGISAWVSLFFVGAVEWLSGRMREHHESWTGQINPPAWAPSHEVFSTLGFVAVVVNGLLLALPLLAFAGANARRLHVAPGSVARQLGGMIAGLTLVLAVEMVLLSQLVLLRNQADRAISQAEMKYRAIYEIRKAQISGHFTPEIASSFSAAPTDPPEAIVDNLIGREGFDALASVQTRIRPMAPASPIPGGTFRMTPEMAARYALLPPASQTNAPSSRTGTLRVNPVAPNR